MNICMRALAALSLSLLCGHAAAVPTLKNVTPTFHQAGYGSATLNVGLLVEASTSLPVLIIAGGFTITCTSSTLPLTAERRATFSGFLGVNETLRIPQVVPSRYSVPGWTSIPMGSCGQCVMQYKGEAKDETSLSVRVGNQGVGVSFTLIPAGEQLLGNAQLINVCRLPQRQCCTPLCSIP
jgi:hypothetical protein